jgi:hypothetical protein
MSYYEEKWADNKLYAWIWFLVACFAACGLFKGCEYASRADELSAMKAEGERNAAAMALSECTSKGGTMYAGQCVVCR